MRRRAELQRLEARPRATRVEEKCQRRLAGRASLRALHVPREERPLRVELTRLQPRFTRPRPPTPVTYNPPEPVDRPRLDPGLTPPPRHIREIDIRRDVGESSVRVKVRAFEPLMVRVTPHRPVRAPIVEHLDGIAVVEEKQRSERKRRFP